MNKIILKQKQKQEQKNKNKKDKDKEEKKSKEKQNPQEIRITKQIIKERLFEHFQNHIGEENRTTPKEIFESVIGFSPLMVDSFSRFYWWEIINKVIRELRRKNESFIIQKSGKFFVLQEQDEADYYKDICDRAIKGMEKSKERADDWVENEKWRDMKLKKDEDKSKTKTTDELLEEVDDKIDKAENIKRKIIKVWKGENE
jgi:hypothetical protein